MKLKETLAELESLGDEKVKKRNSMNGAGDNHFGVPMGSIRKVAKKIKTNTELGLELWGTGNLDARLVAVLVMKPEEVSKKDLGKIVKEGKVTQLADWVNSYLVAKHPDREAMRVKWMQAKDPFHARAGWNLTAIRVRKDAEGLDLDGLLDRIEKEMGTAHEAPQWTMNFVLVEIGIHHKKLRKRALAIGEKLGVFSDFKAPKGCTSPFAPIWINAMVKRQG